MNVLKIVDVVDVGIEKEKARRDFYDKVSKNFKDKEIKGLFENLRDWESTHIKKFTAIRSKLESYKIAESYPEEARMYVDSLVDDMLYREVDGDAFAKNVSSAVQAIQYGIGFEKDAILLFMELTKYVQESDLEVIQELMNEERHHIVSLIKMRKRLEKS